MEFAELGDGKLRLSRAGLGCNNFAARIDLDATRSVVDAALEEDVTFFDTADVYGGKGGSERFLGEVLEGRRERVVLATKFGGDMGAGRNGSAGYVGPALDASLARLRTDYVDVLYYHRPDGKTPIAETIGAMQEQVDAGKVRFLGVSNMTTAELRAAAATAPVALAQSEYSLLRRDVETDVLPTCRELGIGFVPYFPLASGVLSGKYRRDAAPAPETRLGSNGWGMKYDEAPWDRVERLSGWATAHGRTLLEVALAGLVSEPGVVSVIAGATSAEQVHANARAVERLLSPAELDELRSI